MMKTEQTILQKQKLKDMTTMKRSLAAGLMLSIGLALQACGGSTSSMSNPPIDRPPGPGLLGGTAGTQANTLDTIVQDMTMTHEAVPKGVSSSWSGMSGPRIGLGNVPPSGARFLIPWGALYESEVGNTSGNTRVELRNIQLYVLSKSTGKWKKVSASVSPKGEDRKAGVAASSTDIRVEPSGTISVRTAKNGYHFDFWSGQGRVEIDPSDIAGVFSTFQARLILDDPTKPDDRGAAQYIAAAGADYWASSDAGDIKSLGNDAGAGRFKYVINDWRAFNMVTLSEADIRKNPPPLNDMTIPGAVPASNGTGAADIPVAAPPSVGGGTGAGAGSGYIPNTVDTILDDMRLKTDMELAGIPPERGWSTGTGLVTMGNDPRGTRTPSWWNPANPVFKGPTYWTHIAPWMVVFDGVGNAATNTRVEMRNFKSYYKSRSSGQWILLGTGQIEGENYPKYLNATQSNTRPDIRSLGNGTVSVKPPSTELHFHGWCCARALPDPTDIAAIHITLQARLAVHDASLPDDRSVARYLMQMGGDYYPDASLSVFAFAPDNWNPGIGYSRSKLINNAWQSFSFTTVGVGGQDPGGASISEAELRAAPPPLETDSSGSVPTSPENVISGTARILAIGDSMTSGDDWVPTGFRSYRGALYQRLVNAGYQVDFVGTQQMTPAVGGDPDHDGYGGAWIGPGGSANNIWDRLEGILSATNPNVVIVAMGWNSVYNEPFAAAQKYTDLVNRIRALRPDVSVVVATLSPQRGESEGQSAAGVQGYNAFNSAARSIAGASSSDSIYLADYASAGFVYSDYMDVIHWSQSGADRAAGVIYQTLITGPLRRP
jgi:hypothetical protein